MKNIFINKYRRAMKSNIFNDDTDNQYYINNLRDRKTERRGREHGHAGDPHRHGYFERQPADAFLTEQQRTSTRRSRSGCRFRLGTVKVRIHNARKEIDEETQRLQACRRASRSLKRIRLMI